MICFGYNIWTFEVSCFIYNRWKTFFAGPFFGHSVSTYECWQSSYSNPVGANRLQSTLDNSARCSYFRSVACEGTTLWEGELGCRDYLKYDDVSEESVTKTRAAGR